MTAQDPERRGEPRAEDGGATNPESPDDPTTQDHHDPMTEEDTASGGPADP